MIMDYYCAIAELLDDKKVKDIINMSEKAHREFKKEILGAIEKSIEKEVISYYSGHGCFECGSYIESDYCPNCGQKAKYYE